MAAIEVEQLERTFGEGVRAVDGVDLEVAEGEIYAFLGPNGAGKTTTVRMLTTLLRPTGGRARVAGHDVCDEAAAVRRAIGVALQEAALDPLMTGRELIRLQATLHGLPRRSGEERAEALLDRVGLERAADRRVGNYSGGMRRRLDLASALVHEPEVLFLDEPTTGLDPVSRKAIWEEVSKLNADGTTVFLTTQYLEEADQLANRVGIIDSGRIVAEDTPGSLKAEIGRPHLEVGLADGSADEAERILAAYGKPMPRKDGKVLVEIAGGASDVAKVVRGLDEAGIVVESLDLKQPTLDDVFVAKTGYHLEGDDEPDTGRARGDRRGPAARVIDRFLINLRVIGALGKRSIRQTFRRPQLMAPIIIFPTLLLAIQTGGAARAVDLPGFPEVDGFLDFMLAGAMIQSTLLAGNSGGIALAVDIEMGFTDRLLAAPISRFAMVLGRLAGTAVLGAAAAVWFIALGLIFGATISEGVLGAIAIVILVSLTSVAFGGIGAAIALRTGSASVVQGLFPLVFVILFLSSAFFPANLMLDPAASVAEYNPLSFIVEGVRELVISTLSAEAFWKAAAALVGISALSLGLSNLALRRRLRTGG